MVAWLPANRSYVYDIEQKNVYGLKEDIMPPSYF